MIKNTFVDKANSIHNNRYDYSNTEEQFTCHSKITIICPLHGRFIQEAGDHLRGNPLVFCPTDINPVNKKSYGELYKETVARRELIKEHGYKLVEIWESAFKALENQ